MAEPKTTAPFRGRAVPPPRDALDRLVRIVHLHLTDELRRPPWKGSRNHLAGHCFVAAEAIYYMLGGRAAGWVPQSIRHEGSPHWFLLHAPSGRVVDPTAWQFRSDPDAACATGRGFTSSRPNTPSKRARALIDSVRATDAGNQAIVAAWAELGAPWAEAAVVPVGAAQLPVGALLFHGTPYDEVYEVDVPAWFTEDESSAWGWATGREGDNDRPQVAVFRVTKPIRVAVATREMLNGQYGKRAAEYFDVRRRAIAEAMGLPELSGWIVREWPNDVGLRPEVMLMDVTGLEYVRTVHPEEVGLGRRANPRDGAPPQRPPGGVPASVTLREAYDGRAMPWRDEVIWLLRPDLDAPLQVVRLDPTTAVDLVSAWNEPRSVAEAMATPGSSSALRKYRRGAARGEWLGYPVLVRVGGMPVLLDGYHKLVGMALEGVREAYALRLPDPPPGGAAPPWQVADGPRRRENPGGRLRVLAAHVYPVRADYGTPQADRIRAIAHALKTAEPWAIDEAAEAMAPLVPRGARLVPVPTSRGSTSANRALAEAIGSICGARVLDGLRREPGESQYRRREAGLPSLTADQQHVRWAGPPTHGPVVLVDNVTTTGATMESSARALDGEVSGIVWADARPLTA